MKKPFVAIAFIASVGLLPVPAHAQVVGTADTANSIPFDSYLGGYYYQQIYGASAFSGPTTINSLTFYNSLYPGGTPGTGTFDLFLSTSSANISTFDANTGLPWLDGSFVQVFSGSLPAVSNGLLTIGLTTPFDYNPATGNLLLTVRNFSLGGDGNLFLDADQNNGLTNSRFSAYPYDINQGLVTGFNAAVPEPATWAMMLLGFAGIGAVMRRRRRHVFAQIA
jgi:hypothetical protein